jgi:hypothetical protein
MERSELFQDFVGHCVSDLYRNAERSKAGAKVAPKLRKADLSADLDAALEACPDELREFVSQVLSQCFFLGWYSHATIAPRPQRSCLL